MARVQGGCAAPVRGGHSGGRTVGREGSVAPSGVPIHPPQTHLNFLKILSRGIAYTLIVSNNAGQGMATYLLFDV